FGALDAIDAHVASNEEAVVDEIARTRGRAADRVARSQSVECPTAADQVGAFLVVLDHVALEARTLTAEHGGASLRDDVIEERGMIAAAHGRGEPGRGKDDLTRDVGADVVPFDQG